MMKAVVNTKLIMEDGIIWNGTVLINNDRILWSGPQRDIEIPPAAEVIDAHGLYTAPGLVDIHCHGYGDFNFNERPDLCASHFLNHGVTTVLPTLYANLSRNEILEGVKKITQASLYGDGRIMNGLYMEGPYMCATLGSFQSTMKWRGEIDAADYRPLVDELGKLVRIWAIDPARKNIGEFMEYARSINPEVIFALGHSAATAEQCRQVMHYGVRVQTHHGDSGKAKGLAQGTIGAGCDEYTLYNPDLFAELICDEVGIHVVPDMIRMVVRTKGVERIILISDSMCDKGKFINNDNVAYGPDLNYDDAGLLAGSHLTLDNACRNLMAHTGYGLCHAIRFATLNPARLLGLDMEIGSLKPGMRANLILIDDMVHVNRVILEGKIVR